MSLCPKCSSEIADATYCGCGWKRQKSAKYEEPELLIECAHEACQIRAKVKIKTPTGLANLCIPHYELHYFRQANATCEALGLKTKRERYEWVKGRLGKMIAKWKPTYEREPGCDDEEIAA